MNLEIDITGVLIIHNDSSLLEQTLSTVKPYISSLLVVDGAYEWVAPFCELNGEDPDESTDNLIQILNDFGMPYEYHTGIWKSETEKRKFSLDVASNNYLMLVDSDELFDLDDKKIEHFFASEKAIGECFFPLYFSEKIVGESVGLGTAPVKSIFINKEHASTSDLVDSLFLMVPDAERKNKLNNNVRFAEKLGTVHHISSFRTGGTGYRRARFYNLLSMRVSGKLNFSNNEPFSNDLEFFDKIKQLDTIDMECLDNMFRFHRIACSFPNIKENQRLVEVDTSSAHKALVRQSFEGMLEDQYQNLLKILNKRLRFFSGKPIFIDLTNFIKKYNALGIRSDISDKITVSLFLDYGDHRELYEKNDLTSNSSSLEHILNIKNALSDGNVRLVMELIPRANKHRHLDIEFFDLGSELCSK